MGKMMGERSSARTPAGVACGYYRMSVWLQPVMAAKCHLDKLNQNQGMAPSMTGPSLDVSAK
jgi:hypothetical protein